MTVFQHSEFVLAAHRVDQLPEEGGGEVAFAGRSNAGKSSAINAIVRRRRLVFVSKTPGLTQSINYFRLGGAGFLVDLPGYGYAAVSRKDRRAWGSLISAYIRTRRSSLRGLVVVMDVRHPFTPLDRQLLDWLAPLGVASHVLLTKTDKLAKRQATAALAAAEQGVAQWPRCTVQLFSSATGLGVESARSVIAGWLAHADHKKPPVKGE